MIIFLSSSIWLLKTLSCSSSWILKDKYYRKQGSRARALFNVGKHAVSKLLNTNRYWCNNKQETLSSDVSRWAKSTCFTYQHFGNKELIGYQLTFGRGINNLFLKSFVMSLDLEGFCPFRSPTSRFKDDDWIHFIVIGSLGTAVAIHHANELYDIVLRKRSYSDQFKI